MVAEEKSLRDLFLTLLSRLDFVSITLGAENPYKIFKSLNSTGVDLEQGDLFRNHIFMGLAVTDQDAFDDERWRPLERNFELDGKLNGRLFASFFRDVLMRGGNYVGENGIYEAFEDKHPLAGLKPQEVVADLELRAGHYGLIRGKRQHPDKGIDRALRAIRDLNVTTSYPLVLALVDAHERQQMPLNDLVETLRAISGFVLRRYVCGKGSRAYSRWFCSACKALKDKPRVNLVAFFKDKGWPSDAEFLAKFQRVDLYNSKYDRAVLEGIEWSLQALANRSCSTAAGSSTCSRSR
jgi:hypothetical protein